MYVLSTKEIKQCQNVLFQSTIFHANQQGNINSVSIPVKSNFNKRSIIYSLPLIVKADNNIVHA